MKHSTLRAARSRIALLCLLALHLAETSAKSNDTGELFGLDKVHAAHLVFAADQWEAIKPDEPVRGPGGPPRAGGRGGNPFNPAGFLADGFRRGLDGDKNSTVSNAEFVSGFANWFEDWDTKKQGFLDADAFREGINKALMPPVGGPPGGGGGMPGIKLEARDGLRNGLSGMGGIHFDYVHADLELNGEKFRDVAVRYKGNGTYMDARNSEKKSFKVDLNEFVKGQKLFGLTKLNFHNNITDPALINESLAYALYRDAGVPAPRTSYVRLSVSVPGTYDNKYFGLYTLVENPDRDWAKEAFDTKKGLILKPVTRELFIDKGPDWSAYRQAYDAKTDITDSQVRRVVEFSRLITSGSNEELADKLPEFLDLDQFARFMAVTVWLSCTDSILVVGQNFVIHLDPKTKKFVFAPWDLDRAFGNFFGPDPEQLSIGKAWPEDNRFLTRVMSVPAVQDAYRQRMEEFQKTIFEPAKLSKRIDAIAGLIRPAVVEEGTEKAERFDKAISTSNAAPAVEPPGGGPGFRMPAARPIKAFIQARHHSVSEQLAGRSEGKGLGGGPGGPGRGGRGFGLGTFLAPAWIKAADSDIDGQVTDAEFQAVSSRWAGEWDTDQDALLSEAELQVGLGKAFPPPNPSSQGPQPPRTP